MCAGRGPVLLRRVWSASSAAASATVGAYKFMFPLATFQHALFVVVVGFCLFEVLGIKPRALQC
jgi:hypothetical protein